MFQSSACHPRTDVKPPDDLYVVALETDCTGEKSGDDMLVMLRGAISVRLEALARRGLRAADATYREGS